MEPKAGVTLPKQFFPEGAGGGAQSSFHGAGKETVPLAQTWLFGSGGHLVYNLSAYKPPCSASQW